MMEAILSLSFMKRNCHIPTFIHACWLSLITCRKAYV